MTARDLTLAELLRNAMQARASEIHVALPARVESYDAAKQTIDAKPLVKRVVESEDGELAESLPVVPNVPVAFPRSGGFFVSFPIKKGDTVLLVFCERSIDEWRSRGAESEPQDLRMHDLSDAVAIPGVYADGDALADAHEDNMVLGEDGGTQIHIKPSSGEIHLGSENAAEFVALADKTDTEIGDIITAVNNFLTTTFNTHNHSTAMGPSGPPTPTASTISSAQSVAASKVKAD